MAPNRAKFTRRKKDVSVVLNTSPGSSAASSPMRQRSVSRLTQQREEDPERFRASITPDPDLHDKFGRMQAPPAASVERVPPQPSPLAAIHQGPDEGGLGAGQAQAIDVLRSHTGRPRAALGKGSSKWNKVKMRTKVNASKRLCASIVRTLAGAQSIEPERFPRVFDRSQINKWLVAEHCGKSFEELDAISRKGGIMDLLQNLAKLELSNLGLTSALPLQRLPLHHLVVLRLDHNRISKIEGLESLAQLEFLNMSDNLLDGFGCVCELSKLRALDVAFNQIQALSPADLPQCLRFLVTEGNPLQSMKLISWQYFFRKMPVLMNHDTLSVEESLGAICARLSDAASSDTLMTETGGQIRAGSGRSGRRGLSTTHGVAFRPLRHTPRPLTPSPCSIPCNSSTGPSLLLAHAGNGVHSDRRGYAPDQKLEAAREMRANGAGAEGRERTHPFASSPCAESENLGLVDWRVAWVDDAELERSAGGADLPAPTGLLVGSHLSPVPSETWIAVGQTEQEDTKTRLSIQESHSQSIQESHSQSIQESHSHRHVEDERPCRHQKGGLAAELAGKEAEAANAPKDKMASQSLDFIDEEAIEEITTIVSVNDQKLGPIQVEKSVVVVVPKRPETRFLGDKDVYGGLGRWRKEEEDLRKYSASTGGAYLDPTQRKKMDVRVSGWQAQTATMQELRQTQCDALASVTQQLASVRETIQASRPFSAPGANLMRRGHKGVPRPGEQDSSADGKRDLDPDVLLVQEVMHQLWKKEGKLGKASTRQSGLKTTAKTDCQRNGQDDSLNLTVTAHQGVDRGQAVSPANDSGGCDRGMTLERPCQARYVRQGQRWVPKIHAHNTVGRGSLEPAEKGLREESGDKRLDLTEHSLQGTEGEEHVDMPEHQRLASQNVHEGLLFSCMSIDHAQLQRRPERFVQTPSSVASSSLSRSSSR